MKTKIYVSGKYIQANENKKKKKAKSLEKARKNPKSVKEDLYLGMVLSINKEGDKEELSHEAHIVDSNGNVVAKVIYDPFIEKGAKLWIETEFEVKPIVNKY